jgi:hypothetical protein
MSHNILVDSWSRQAYPNPSGIRYHVLVKEDPAIGSPKPLQPVTTSSTAEEALSPSPPDNSAMRKINSVGLLAMVLAWRVAGLKLIERAVLAALGTHADKSGYAWPGEELLAVETSLSSRSVRKAVRSLENRGLVKVVRGRQHHPNSYAIQCGMLEALPTVAKRPVRPEPASDLESLRVERGDSSERNASAGQTGTMFLLTAHRTAQRTAPPIVPHGGPASAHQTILAEYQRLAAAANGAIGPLDGPVAGKPHIQPRDTKIVQRLLDQHSFDEVLYLLRAFYWIGGTARARGKHDTSLQMFEWEWDRLQVLRRTGELPSETQVAEWAAGLPV